MVPGWLIQAAADLAITAGKKLWAGSSWSKDRRKVSTVEAHVRELMVNAGALFSNGVPGDPDGIMRPLLERFEGDLVNSGVPEQDAKRIAEQESKTIHALIIEPQRQQSELREQVAAVQRDFQALRQERSKADSEIASLRSELTKAHRMQGVLLALAAIALILAIVALTGAHA